MKQLLNYPHNRSQSGKSSKAWWWIVPSPNCHVPWRKKSAWNEAKARGEKLPPVSQKNIPPEVPGQQ